MTALRSTFVGTVLAALTAGQAFSLTPLPPPCSYGAEKVDGRMITNTDGTETGFVTYETVDDAGRLYYYLEQCSSGKILRAISGPESLKDDSPRSAYSLSDVMVDAIYSDAKITVGALRRKLNGMKITTKRYTSRTESCACQTYFPEAIGTKTPYEEDTK